MEYQTKHIIQQTNSYGPIKKKKKTNSYGYTNFMAVKSNEKKIRL